MNPFATLPDMVTRFGEEELIQVTDDSNSGAMDEAQVLKALEDATAELEGYISTRVNLPLDPVPSVLVKKCCDVARYHLHDDSPTDRIDINYQSAIEWAVRVSKGTVTLNDGTQQADTSATDQVQVSEGSKVFTNETLDQY